MMKLNIILSADGIEQPTMYPNSDSSIAIIGNDTHEIIRYFFDSLLYKYQIGLEQSMRRSKLSFCLFFRKALYVQKDHHQRLQVINKSSKMDQK